MFPLQPQVVCDCNPVTLHLTRHYSHKGNAYILRKGQHAHWIVGQPTQLKAPTDDSFGRKYWSQGDVNFKGQFKQKHPIPPNSKQRSKHFTELINIWTCMVWFHKDCLWQLINWSLTGWSNWHENGNLECSLACWRIWLSGPRTGSSTTQLKVT